MWYACPVRNETQMGFVQPRNTIKMTKKEPSCGYHISFLLQGPKERLNFVK